MTIEIIIYNDDGDVLAQRHSSSFGSAEEDLGKLERWYEDQEEKLRMLQKYGETKEI